MMQNEFVFLTPVFNCEQTIVQTMLSVIGQSYNSWKIIIIDDCSTDRTSEQIIGLTNALGLNDRIDLIKRTRKYGETENTVETLRIHPWCHDNAIIARLDGGDYMISLDALAYINYSYNIEKADFVWTGQSWGFDETRNISAPMPDGVNPYHYPWVSSHLKTYRKYLINDVNDANFRDEDGNYIMIACDQVVSLPMLYKTKKRFFLNKILYHYSIDLSNPNLFSCERSIKQKYSAEWIRSRGFIQ